MRTLLVALLALTLTPSLAHARSIKGSTVLIVKNSGSDTLAVLVDDSGAVLNANSLDAVSFFRAGGRLIGPGGSTAYALKAGSHTVIGAYVRGFTPDAAVGASSTTTVTTTKNQTTTVRATGSVNSGVTFSP